MINIIIFLSIASLSIIFICWINITYKDYKEERKLRKKQIKIRKANESEEEFNNICGILSNIEKYINVMKYKEEIDKLNGYKKLVLSDKENTNKELYRHKLRNGLMKLIKI